MLDRVEPLYVAAYLAAGLTILTLALRSVRSTTALRQLRWIVWGTALGAGPFILAYAVPFAFGATPSLAMELTAVPLGLMPLAFASAIVRYRLMDVEIILKRLLVYSAALSAIAGIYVHHRPGHGWLLRVDRGRSPVGHRRAWRRWSCCCWRVP